MIILYITVAFANHSSRRLLANQKPTTLRKNVAKLNETSLRYFRLILDPIRYTDSQFIGGDLSINYRKTFQTQLLSLSLSLISLKSFSIVHSCITLYIRYITVILASCLLLTYVMYVINELCMIHDIVNPL